MAKAQNIPSEILQGIFMLLPKSTVYQCLFVCNLWNLVATQQYHKVLSISGEMIIVLQEKLAANETPQRLLSFGDMVQTLIVHDDYSKHEKLSKPDLSTLLSYLPNLKIFDLSRCRKLVSFMNHLDQLLKERNYQANEFLKYLQRLKISPNAEGVNQWQRFRIDYAFRKSLEYLYICFSLKKAVPLNTGQQQVVKNPLNALHHFICLTHLSIVDKEIETLSITQISKACPYLIVLHLEGPQLTIQPDDSAPPTESKITTVQKKQQQQLQQFHATTQISNGHYFQCLKSLYLHIGNIQIDQLVLCIPHQLEVLDLDLISDTMFNNWIKKCNQKTLESFTKQLNSIKRLHIELEPSCITRHREINKILQQEDSFYDWYKFMEAVLQDRKLTCYLDLEICQRTPIRPFSLLSPRIGEFSPIDIDDGKMNMKHWAYILKDDEEEDTNFALLLPPFLGGKHSKYSSSFTNTNNLNGQLPGKLRHLSLVIRGSETEKALYHPYVQVLLENILVHCTRLNHLKLELFYGMFYLFRSSTYQDDYESRVNLSIQEKYQQFITSSTATNLTYCEVKWAPFTQSQCDIFNSSLPNLKIIHLIECTYPAKDKYNNLTFDLSGIDHLISLTIDISSFIASNCDDLVTETLKLYLQCEYTDYQSNLPRIGYYWCEIDCYRGIKSMHPITYDDIEAVNGGGFKSKNTTIITFKFSRINVVNLVDGDDSDFKMYIPLVLCPISKHNASGSGSLDLNYASLKRGYSLQ